MNEQYAQAFRSQFILSEKRIVYKISGDILSSENSTYNVFALQELGRVLQEIYSANNELIIVVGAGNIIRGRAYKEMLKGNQVIADTAGMYATVVNSLVLKEILNSIELPNSIFVPASLIGAHGGNAAVLHGYDYSSVQFALEKKDIVICAGGIGNPFFTTDSAAVLRGIELQVDLIVKATKVNGIYSADPLLSTSATRYSSITYDEAVKKKLKIMDQTAFVLAQEHKKPLFIYKYGYPMSLVQALADDNYGTFVSS